MTSLPVNPETAREEGAAYRITDTSLKASQTPRDIVRAVALDSEVQAYAVKRLERVVEAGTLIINSLTAAAVLAERSALLAELAGLRTALEGMLDEHLRSTPGVNPDGSVSTYSMAECLARRALAVSVTPPEREGGV